jgi:uncharacterized protein (DUF697 family)
MEHIPIYGITVKLRLRLISQWGQHVNVTDAKECKITVSVTITEPTLLTASAVQVSPVVGESNGSATVTPAGGNGTYTYLWITVKLQLRLILNVGHDVTVADAKECKITVSVKQ